MSEVSPGGMLSIGVIVASWGETSAGVTLVDKVSVRMVAVHTGSKTINSGGGNAPSWPATPWLVGGNRTS